MVLHQLAGTLGARKWKWKQHKMEMTMTISKTFKLETIKCDRVCDVPDNWLMHENGFQSRIDILIITSAFARERYIAGTDRYLKP